MIDRVVEVGEGASLRISQQPELGLGGSVWDAALTLCLLLPHPVVAGLLHTGGWSSATVCELGSGTGVCGLTAAALGASCVVLSDLPAFLPLLQLNIERNGLQGGAQAVTHAWGDDVVPLLQQTGGRPHFDAVLVSDCVYEPASYDALLRSLRALCPTAHTVSCTGHRAQDTQCSRSHCPLTTRAELPLLSAC